MPVSERPGTDRPCVGRRDAFLRALQVAHAHRPRGGHPDRLLGVARVRARTRLGARADTFSLGGCFACWLDTKIFGWADPEGLLSTLPAIVTTMGGVFVGELVRSDRFSGGRKTLLMLGAAVVSGLLSWGWSPFCPVVKKLWTSTFVLAAWSYSLACFAVFYWVIDVLRVRKWTVILRVIGVNSILIYFLRILVDFHKPANFFFHALAEQIGGPWTAVIDNVAYILIVWLVMFFLYRKKVFWRV